MRGADAFLLEITPSASPQPFLPLLAPSPLTPFTNSTIQKLSGLCMLNFTAAQNLMTMTSIDCWAAFAPLLANVICCPQLHATLVILVDQLSKETGVLALNQWWIQKFKNGPSASTTALNRTLAKPCLSDIEQVLEGQGVGKNLKQVCSIHPSNLSEAYYPVKDDEFENTVNSYELLASCEKIDPVKECCDQVCQGAISDAATRLAPKASDPLSMDGPRVLPEHSTRVNDCKTVVLRWLAICPLVFPNMKHVANSCGNGISNPTTCCDAMDSYVSHLQKQTHVTNLQALDCSTSLGLKLQKYNITKNVYSLCHISLKDFSLQVPKGQFKGANPSLTVTDSRTRHIFGKTQIRTKGLARPMGHQQGELGYRCLAPKPGVVIQEIKNPDVRLWSEKIQKEKGDSLQGSYVSELRYGDIALLLHVKTDEPLIRALVRFWNPGYNCFTFNQEDMTWYLHQELVFQEQTAKIAGVDEKWVTDRLRNKGLYGLIIFPKILGCIDAAVLELFEQLPKQVNPAPTILAETFRSLNHCRRAGGGRFIGCFQLLQVWIHSHFWKTNGVAYRRFSTTDVLFQCGDSDTMTLPELWDAVGYAPLLALRHYGARQFVPTTCGLTKSEFEYHDESYKKRIKEIVNSWKKVLRMDIVADKDMLTPDYLEWRRLQKNDNTPVPNCEDTRTMEEHLRHVPSGLEIAKTEFEAVNNELGKRIKELEAERYQWNLYADSQKDRADKLEREQKRVCLELEDLRKGYQDKVKDNSKLKLTSKYWNERAWKEQMKTAQTRLAGSQHQNQCLRIRMADMEKQHERDGKTIAELEAIVDGFKKQASKLQIVPFDGCLQWRFRWEQAQQRVKARDAVIRDFLDKVQKAAHHLHGLARETGMVRKGIQPVTDEDRRLVNLLEAVWGLEDLV
ncbi:Detected protein of unknown function [Hibiscus syriacus]|uniref:Uncharacterized protein n=1 Tax=Hibiscus syriacus TaxID=106335 RepID=A0A6A3BJB4_HIBSY|nr:Detected protein of unknown function [Hibiscus syriacus]